jgi:hypothetical protein
VFRVSGSGLLKELAGQRGTPLQVMSEVMMMSMIDFQVRLISSDT